MHTPRTRGRDGTVTRSSAWRGHEVRADLIEEVVRMHADMHDGGLTVHLRVGEGGNARQSR